MAAQLNDFSTIVYELLERFAVVTEFGVYGPQCFAGVGLRKDPQRFNSTEVLANKV